MSLTASSSPIEDTPDPSAVPAESTPRIESRRIGRFVGVVLAILLSANAFVCATWSHFFGLPGNPVSAWVTFLLLVRPALLRWQGATEPPFVRHPGILCEPLANPGPRRHFIRVKVDAEGKVSSAGLQASHALSSLAVANGLVDVPPATTLPAGAPVQVIRVD